MNAGARAEWTRYRRLEGVEALNAHLVSHVYHRHTHDTYSFGVTEDGAQAFRTRGGAWVSRSGLVMAFNPDDPHDGHTGSPGGFTYRMVYVDPEQVRTALGEAGYQADLPLFAEPVISDPELVGRVRRAAAGVLAGTDPLATQEALDAMVVTAVSRHARSAGPRRTEVPAAPSQNRYRSAEKAGLVRDLLHDRYAEQVTAHDLAAAVGASRFQVYRDFQARYGMPPSAYLRQVRLRAARRLLAAGLPAAHAAVQAGFADQAHLTRWFRRVYGITPATYQRGASRL